MTPESSVPDIVCRSTKWYLWHRVLPLSIIPLAMAAWFFYDYKVGYPEKLREWEEYVEFKKLNDDEQAWLKQGKSKKPKEMNQAKVDEQLHYCIGAGILGLAALAYYLLNWPKKLTADATSFTTPWGKRIEFSTIERLDKRKWKHKGLAYAHFKTADGPSGKAVLDDLRFDGAQKILDRIEALSPAEIIDLAETESSAEPAAEGSKSDES